MSSYRMKYRIGSTQYNIPVQEDISAIPLGTILPYSANSEYPPAGFLFCDGSAVSRTMYPDLFALIGTTFGNGDGVSTFNLPDLTLGEFLEGSSVAGTSKSAGLPNITGNMRRIWKPMDGSIASADGAFAIDTSQGDGGSSDAVVGGFDRVSFDASRSSAVYGNSTTVQPKSVTVRYIIKAFNATTSSSELIDITQYASALNQKYDVGSDWCYIYPNNGTESNPANVTLSNRYVLDNPFPGYLVFCVAEILYDNNWGATEWLSTYMNSGWQTYGTKANQFNSGSIVVQVGNNSVLTSGVFTGNSFGTLPNNYSSLPCRVKVWKIGKIPQSP